MPGGLGDVARFGAALAGEGTVRLATITRAVLDAVPDGIGLVDDDGRLVLSNRHLDELRHAGVELPEPPRDEHATTDEFQPRDSHRRFERHTRPVRDPRGGRLGRLVVLREITRERDVARRKDELIATIAHELRGPLAVITGFVELLAGGGPSGEDREHGLQVVLAEARRLQALVDDLLDIERLEDGPGRVRHDEFDVVGLLERQVALHRAHHPDHTISLHAERPCPHALGDPGRVAQVVGNLLSNAIKYSPGGGDVRVSAASGGDVVTVEVADAGLGIPAADQPRVFERFYRAQAPAHQEIDGSGLGLALSRQIVLAHGGTLRFRSTDGEGSRFWFTLPRAPARFSAAPRPG